MNKLAAEKIAQQYYQIGQQLALESMGMTKEADAKSKLLKALGGLTAGGAAGLSPAALHGLGKLESSTGYVQLEALKNLMAGKGSSALGNLSYLPAAAKSDASTLGNLISNKAGAAGQSISDFAQSMNIMEALKNLSHGN